MAQRTPENPSESEEREFMAFLGSNLVARGGWSAVVAAARQCHRDQSEQRVAVFDEKNGRRLDVCLGDSPEEIRVSQFPPDIEVHDAGGHGEVVATDIVDEACEVPGNEQSKRRGAGRPRLGVVSREISLLPRHWQWLAGQRGGASATLRRLVDRARKNDANEFQIRSAIEATHRFLWDMAEGLVNFEEASRVLFARDFQALQEKMRPWPKDIREQVQRFLDRAKVASTMK